MQISQVQNEKFLKNNSEELGARNQSVMGYFFIFLKKFLSYFDDFSKFQCFTQHFPTLKNHQIGQKFAFNPLLDGISRARNPQISVTKSTHH